MAGHLVAMELMLLRLLDLPMRLCCGIVIHRLPWWVGSCAWRNHPWRMGSWKRRIPVGRRHMVVYGLVRDWRRLIRSGGRHSTGVRVRVRVQHSWMCLGRHCTWLLLSQRSVVCRRGVIGCSRLLLS